MMHTYASTLILLAVLISCMSCRSVINIPRQTNDLAVHIHLNRSYAQRHGDMVGFDHHHHHLHIEKPEDLLTAVFAIIIESAAESLIERLPKTKFEIFPNSRKDYRQRLYWGENTVYFPHDSISEDKESSFLIIISGDREYSNRIVFTLGENKIIKLH